MCWDHHYVDWSHMILEAIFNKKTRHDLAEKDFMVYCIPECRPGMSEPLISRERLQMQIWEFLRLNYRRLSPSHRGMALVDDFRQAFVQNRDWPSIIRMMRTAYGISQT